jgi:hypothetical protein
MTHPPGPADAPVFTGLRALAGCGGCAAKAPAELVSMLAGLAASASPAAGVLVGLAPFDDGSRLRARCRARADRHGGFLSAAAR